MESDPLKLNGKHRKKGEGEDGERRGRGGEGRRGERKEEEA